MNTTELPKIYLATSSQFDRDKFPDVLTDVLAKHNVACLRLDFKSQNEEDVIRSADICREIAHRRDIPVVITNHVHLVAKLGLDGVHLESGARYVRAVRKQLGNAAIVGSFCQDSRHEGITAGEAGADYISFGPVTTTLLGSGKSADIGLFEWWSEMIEIPVIAEGNITGHHLQELAPVVDFIGVGEEIWHCDNPAEKLAVILQNMLRIDAV